MLPSLSVRNERLIGTASLKGGGTPSLKGGSQILMVSYWTLASSANLFNRPFALRVATIPNAFSNGVRGLVALALWTTRSSEATRYEATPSSSKVWTGVRDSYETCPRRASPKAKPYKPTTTNEVTAQAKQ